MRLTQQTRDKLRNSLLLDTFGHRAMSFAAIFHTTWLPKPRPEHCWPRHGQGAPRYFVFGFKGNSDRLFGVSQIEPLKAGRAAVRYCTRSISTVMQY
jgi:hypothetical protein